MNRPVHLIVVIALASLALSACQTTQPQVVMSTKSALELRSVQSRIFETADEGKIYRAMLSVMQDQGYAITSVEPDAGVVTGNKLALLDLTAVVSKRDEQSTRVRANAIVRLNYQMPQHQVDSPEFYQQRFFEPLSQALFLDALYDEDAMEEEDKATIVDDTNTNEEARSQPQ